MTAPGRVKHSGRGDLILGDLLGRAREDEPRRRQLEQLEHMRILVLDLSAVEQLDAGGLGMLLELRRWARQHSVQIKLVNPSPFVYRVLAATRLTSVFEISSLEEALGILQAPDDPPRYAVA